MARPCLRWPARLPLLLLLLCGCLPGSGAWWLVVPEQRHLEVRDPSQIPSAAIPPLPPPATVSSPPPPGDPRELSLDEAIRIALANSQVVRVLAGVTVAPSGQTIYDPAISNTAIDEARATFDPTVVFDSTWDRTESPQAFLDPADPTGARIDGVRVDASTQRVALSKRTVSGATVGLDVVHTRSRFQPGVFPLNPEDRSSVTLSYTRPLLRGAGVGPNLAPIVIARLNTERSYFQFKDSVQELVRSVIEGYWGVVLARTEVWVRRQQVEQGEFAYKLAEARRQVGVKDGTAAAVAQTRVALFNFRANLITAEANLLQLEAALRNLLGLPPTVPERLTLTTPPMAARVEPKWEEVVKLAEQLRPDLIELNLILEADRQSLLQANNQARPQLDAVMFYRWNGLEGETPTRARLESGPGQFTDWTLGVNFSVPLGLRQARAALRRTELLIARDTANLQQGLHSAVHALAASLRDLAQFYEQYRAFRETRGAARTNLDAQLAEFQAGRTIYLNVLQAISDWGNAVSAEAQALARYNTALANLERQTGTILETHGVRFHEERYGSIGPFGRLGGKRSYPATLPPGPNADRYPVRSEPAEKALERERPTLPTPAPARLGVPVPKEKRD